MSLQSVAIAASLLSSLAVGPSPWLKIEAGSEQRQPVYIGANPHAMQIDGALAESPSLPQSLRDKLLALAPQLKKAVGQNEFDVEAWPVQDDEGQRTWAFARYRTSRDGDWQWFDAKDVDGFEGVLPKTLATWRRQNVSKIFDDFLTLSSLYDKPLFGECVFTDEAGTTSYGAWLPPNQAPEYRKTLERAVCHNIPQPARFNDKPVTIPIHVRGSEVRLPKGIMWTQANEPDSTAIQGNAKIGEWPVDFREAYERDVRTIEKFKHKNSADSQNQIARVVEFLENRYASLGIETKRQEFNWRGIREMNLIARIKGSRRDASMHPVLMADHIDTAFEEDTFRQTGKRVSAPGADDNGSAVAALLRAAEILKDRQPEYDIWLVHLTGEEFPGDCLGARFFVSQRLAAHKDIRGLVLMDMIGYQDSRHHNQFQINAGESEESVKLARLALGNASIVAPRLHAHFRSRFDDKSYLYNTDGIIFSDAGYPVVLINEYINKMEHMMRHHYHQTTDTSDTMDFDYATSIAKVAIETAAQMAGAR